MSERKTIQINPSLFEFSTKKTRQKKPKIDGGIKMKSSISKPPKNKSLKNGILKMIREKQQNDYQKLFSEKTGANKKPNNLPEVDSFKNEFQESIDYLKALEEKEKKTDIVQPKNKTLKNYDNFIQPTSNAIVCGSDINDIENVNLSVPDVFNQMPPLNEIKLNTPILQNSTHNPFISKPQPSLPALFQNTPQWGCMKVGGKLPTFRSWKNATQKNNHLPSSLSSSSPAQIPTENNSPKPESESVVNLMKESQIERIKKKSAIKQMKNQVDNLNKPVKVKHAKQRKIARRTYRIGKSKVLPKVSVLVSNRTLRNNITTKAQLLKQTPINEVKRFLIKRGFIKVGSNTPNDILRKMYESVSLICGEVQNHNSENLLYNFLHGDV
jgi:hypothetical protein